MPSVKDPISREEAADLFALVGLGSGARVGLAVSGGADSMALAVLAKSLLDATAFVVDHGLRAESAAEAALTVTRLENLGISAHLVTLTLDPENTGLQARARSARYESLIAACTDERLSYLLTGHNRGDQAETLLMRLARGSGLQGLGAMRRRRLAGGGVWLLRPLLSVPKSRLIATLRARDLDWIEDPSNHSTDFERVRVRQALATTEGATTQRVGAVEAVLAEAADAIRHAEDAIQSYARRLIAGSVDQHFGLWLSVSRGAWTENGWPEEIRLRATATLVDLIKPADYAPATELLKRLEGLISGDDGAKALTVQGVYCAAQDQDTVILCPEWGRIQSCKPGGDRQDFIYAQTLDVRMSCEGAPNTADWRVAPLGDRGWQQLAGGLKANGHPSLEWPYAVRLAAPALFIGDKLVSAPLMDYTKRESGPSISVLRSVLKDRFLALGQGMVPTSLPDP